MPYIFPVLQNALFNLQNVFFACFPVVLLNKTIHARGYEFERNCSYLSVSLARVKKHITCLKFLP